MPNENYKFEARDLTRTFGQGKKVSTAVDHVSFKIKDRDIVSLVGQSGCGKTVLAKMMLRLETPTSGELLFNGKPIDDAKDPRDHWRLVQAVFQDPFSAFNQFFTIRAQLKSSFQLFKEKPSKGEIDDRVDQALLAVQHQTSRNRRQIPVRALGWSDAAHALGAHLHLEAAGAHRRRADLAWSTPAAARRSSITS